MARAVSHYITQLLQEETELSGENLRRLIESNRNIIWQLYCRNCAPVTKVKDSCTDHCIPTLHTYSNKLLPDHGCTLQLETRKSPEPHCNRVSRVFQCLFSRHLSYSICKSRVHLHSSYQHVPRQRVSIIE
jgi:hypothetical protein